MMWQTKCDICGDASVVMPRDWTCETCGQAYLYDDRVGHVAALTQPQFDVLRDRWQKYGKKHTARV